ncbi:hypothetical protein [Nocardia callitridis]
MSSTRFPPRLCGDGAPVGRPEERTSDMKYLAMIYGNQAKWDAFPAEA